MFPVTWGGNANAWAGNARAQGYVVDRNPEVGSIIQTNESSRGHVAYVDRIEGGLIFISEMNYAGWNKISFRVIPVGSPLIRAVIHRR